MLLAGKAGGNVGEWVMGGDGIFTYNKDALARSLPKTRSGVLGIYRRHRTQSISRAAFS